MEIRKHAGALFADFLTPQFWILGLVAFAALTLAFQVPYVYRIEFGAESSRQFVNSGFYDPEREPDGRAFRWTKDAAQITIPALTAGDWEIALTINGWQVEGAVPVEIALNDLPPVVFNTSIEWEEYRAVKNLAAGDAVVTIRAQTFRPADFGNPDPRSLGVRLNTLELAPASAGLRIPPMGDYVLPLTLIVLGVYLLVRWCGFQPVCATGAGVAMLVAGAALVGWFRIYLNAALMQSLGFALLASFIFALAILPFVARIFVRGGVGVSASALKWLGLMLAGAFILLVAGTFYPQIFVIDALFHLHRLQFIEAGQLFFTTSSREFGSMQTVYPPAFYVFLAPLAFLLPEPLTLIKLLPIALHLLGALVLFYLARKNSLSERAALLAVLIYLMAPLALVVFAWGVYANIFALELALVTLMVWFVAAWKPRPWASFALLGFLFFFGFLAHASLVPFLFVFWGVFLTTIALWQKDARGRIGWTLGALAVAAIAAFVLYFAVFAEKTISDLVLIQSRGGGSPGRFAGTVGAGLADKPLGLTPVKVTSVPDLIAQGVWYLARETWAYYRTVPFIAALVGAFLLWRRESTRLLGLNLAAGFVALVIFWGIGLRFNLYTRYMFLALPFVALGAGYAFDRLWASSRWGRWATIASVILLAGQGIVFWVTRVLL